MKLLFLISALLIPSLVAAQDNGVAPYAKCAELLNSPPLDTVLTQNDGQDYDLLPSNQLGASLLGVKCSRDQIVEYFLSAGWEFQGESKGYSVNGPPSDRFERDTGLAFCKPRKLPWRLIFYRCGPFGGFSLFENRVTHILTGFKL